MTLTPEHIELIIQWFNSVQDVTPEYLNEEDYKLALEMHKHSSRPIPHSVMKGAGESCPEGK